MKSINTLAAISLLGTVIMTGSIAAHAEMSEKENLKKCELSICELIVKKQAGDNIKCDLTKSWGAKELKKGASHGKIKWSFGDAQCRTKIDIARAPLLKALGDPAFDLKLAPTNVDCLVGDDKDAVAFTLAPELKFEKGAVVKATLGIDNIKGPFMKRMVLKSAQLIDKSSLLNGVIAKEVNKFITKICPGQIK